MQGQDVSNTGQKDASDFHVTGSRSGVAKSGVKGRVFKE